MNNDIYIPPTAKLVKVTNVIDPFHLRIYDVENHATKMGHLEAKLHQIAKTELREYRDDMQPQIGDLVLINSRNSFNVELPAWCCTGIVGSGKTPESKYRVFLPDHGIALEFWIEELKILPPSFATNEFLTSAVGVANVLPVTLKDWVPCISEQWSSGAVKFTREIIGSASQIYFDHLTFDKSRNKFGELYLILDKEVVTLSKSLVCNHYATFINDSLIKMIENLDTITLKTSIEIKENGIEHNDSTEDSLEHGASGASTEGRTDSDRSDNVNGRDRSEAVYERAFNGALKKKNRTRPDHEILICSKIQCEQLESVTDARFPLQIHKALKLLSLKKLKRLQGYVWPAITRGLNVVVVAAPKSGKTISYLVPVVSSIAEVKTFAEVPEADGPLALILCISAVDVYKVHKQCEILLQNNPKVRALPAYNGITERSVVANIYNGCKILITTPPYLRRLIRKDKKLLNFKTLSHMVLDGADAILEMYQESLREILKITIEVQNERRELPGEMPLQMIAIAQHWTPSLNKLVNTFMKDPYVCIGSYMEAAVCAGLKPKLIFLSKDQKAAKIVELLDTRWSMIKTMIVCTTTEEAMELVEVLKSNSIDTLIAHNKTIFTEIQGIKETWMSRVSGKYFVLVCTDQVLSDLNIKDVEWLIHYSLNSSTKTRFYYRFSTLTSNFFSRIHGKKQPKPNSTLIADETNDAQLNGVINVMRRLEAKIPPQMEKYLEKIFESVEMAKTNRSLCENIKAFGRCLKRNSCASRHMFAPDIDEPTTGIRSGDWVKLIITGMHSTNHYSVRVKEYTKANTNEQVVFSFQEFIELSSKIQKHFANPANRRSSKTVNFGDVCAFEDSLNHYKRVQVLSDIDKSSVNTQDILVRSIDDGKVLSIKACKLLEIPEELAQCQSHIVDIYLAGIIPFDNEPDWSPCSNDIVSEWFEENLVHPTASIYVKVLLHLSHVLWVDPLEVRHKLPDGYSDLVDSSLKATLIKAKCATENKDHILNLVSLCGISMAKTDESTQLPD